MLKANCSGVDVAQVFCMGTLVTLVQSLFGIETIEHPSDFRVIFSRSDSCPLLTVFAIFEEDKVKRMLGLMELMGLKGASAKSHKNLKVRWTLQSLQSTWIAEVKWTSMSSVEEVSDWKEGEQYQVWARYARYAAGVRARSGDAIVPPHDA